MKKILLAIAAATLMLISCKQEEKIPTVEFEQTFYKVYSHSTVTINVRLSKASTETVTVPLRTSGTAVLDTDYRLQVTSLDLTFKPGEVLKLVTLKDIDLTPEKSVTLTLGEGEGYQVGTKYVTVISLDDEESLIYSFKTPEAVLLESYIVSVSLTGTTSGDEFRATEDLTFVLSTVGEGRDGVLTEPVKVQAGQNIGTATLLYRDGMLSSESVCSVGVDPMFKRYVKGEIPSLLLHVRGLQTPEKLLGTWTFQEVYDLEEMELWFMEYDDDPDELPTHNEGFTLTFAKEGDEVVVTPGGTGDFLKFFRKSKVSLAAPKNLVANGVKLGNYSTEEGNMFVSEVAETYQQNTYYKLETANLAFSANSEQLGSAIVVFRITPDGDLCVEFREYNNADEFGATWWDGGTKFDPDMFGFASLFKKVQ